MKTLGLLGLISILFYSNAFTSEAWVRLPITGIEKTEFEGIFKLKTSEDYARVKLDCLSFIHGINFYDKDENKDWSLSYSFPLTEYSCGRIYKFINKSLDKDLPACVELNVTENTYELTRKEESCRLGF